MAKSLGEMKSQKARSGGGISYNSFASYLRRMGFKDGESSDYIGRKAYIYESPDYRKERFTGEYKDGEPVMEKAQGFRIEVQHNAEDAQWNTDAPFITYQYARGGKIVNGTVKGYRPYDNLDMRENGTIGSRGRNDAIKAVQDIMKKHQKKK